MKSGYVAKIKNVKNPNQDPNADCIERLNTKWVPNPNLPTEDGFVATDDVVEALATLGGKQWELYAWLREVRADILALQAACDLPPDDPRDPPSPPFD